MIEESQKKGFSGLSSLVSDIEAGSVSEKAKETLRSRGPSAGTEGKAGEAGQKVSSARNAQSDERASSPHVTNQGQSPSSKDSLSLAPGWWAVGIIFFALFFEYGLFGGHNSSKVSGYSSSGAVSSGYRSSVGTDKGKPAVSEDGSRSATKSQSTNSDVFDNGYTPAGKEMKFDKPSVGRGRVLSVAQIRWCLRQKVRVATKRPLVKTTEEINIFNAMVSDYNQRCRSFRYQKWALERAKKDVEGMRSQIVAEVLKNSRETGSRLIHRGSMKGRSALTYKVQALLKKNGYDPGPIDGLYGRKTKAAIENFERDNGIRPKGVVSEELEKLLSNR